MQFLIQNGADVEARDRSGDSALDWAASKGDSSNNSTSFLERKK